MADDYRTRKTRPLNRIVSEQREQDALEKSYSASKRIAFKLNQKLKAFRVGIDFANVANVRVKEKGIVLFVETPAQKVRLTQLIPRISEFLVSEGMYQTPEIKVRPGVSPLHLRGTVPTGTPRKKSPVAAQKILEKSETVTNEKLKRSLQGLAFSLSGNH